MTAPIVLVHGAWHGPWCWNDVAEHLRDAGHQVIVAMLPGHDRPGDSRRIWNRISHYVSAVGDAAASCDRPAVLVGHSMGGYVVQRYLEQHTAAAGVLVASAPWNGTLAANLRLIRSAPRTTLTALATADYSGVVASAEQVRSLFFTPDTADEIVDATATQLQNESAIALTTMVVRRVRTGRVTTPISVIGATGDGVFTPAEQHGLAAAYSTTVDMVDGGHDLMLGSTSAALADRIAAVADAHL